MYYPIFMKAIVLAGGHATRLWPITKNRAKPLLPLGEKPIIDYIIEDMEDVDEIIISTNEKFAGDFEDYTDEYNRDNVRVVVEEQDSEEEKPGTIGAIIKLLDKEGLEDDLLVIGGDNYYSFDIADFIDFAQVKDAPANVVYDVKDKDLATSFGIVDTEGDEITGFEEKPDVPPSTLASTACYFFPEDKVSLFHEYEDHFRDTDIPAEKYLDEPGRLIEWAHEQTQMFAFSFDGDWFDIGTPTGYLNAMDAVVEVDVVNGEAVNSDIGDNVFIMQGARVENSCIENAIIFPGAEIHDSQIRNSIIDRDTEVENTQLNDAIIGEHTTL